MDRILANIAYLSVISGAICFLLIVLDILIGNRQKMGIMNLVWPLTGLYLGIIGFLIYYRMGRKDIVSAMHDNKMNKLFWQSVLVATTHCGAGCTLGDIIGEYGIFLSGLVLFSSPLFTMYIVDFVLAYTLGIIFQYFSIAPMRNLNLSNGIKAAIKADTLSLAAFEIGMFTCMAFIKGAFPTTEPNTILYWFLMQIAMIIGFITSYPVNWLLVKKGIKEEM